MIVSVALLLVVSLQGCLAFSGGPPISVCSTLRPMHPGDPSSGNGGYVITTDIPMSIAESGYAYVPNTTYTVTLRGTTNTFRGFAVRGVSIVDESPLGSFVPGANQQLLGCTPPDYTIVHNNPAPGTMDFTEQTFTWQAPSEEGEVDFRYSVVRFRMNTGEYYVGLSALGREPGTETPAAVTGFNPVEAGVTEPAIAPHNYRLMIKEPSSCNVSDCSVFVGIDTNRGNDEFLNVYMEANAEAWVAVGFSNSANMFSADVLACNLRPDGEVEVLDTWNLDEGRGNVRDDVDDTLMFASSVVDGRIKCSFVRSIAGTGDTQDLNLNNDYYVLFGRSDGEQSSGFLRSHRNGGDRNPFITEERINVADADSRVSSAGNLDPTTPDIFIDCILIYTLSILIF